MIWISSDNSIKKTHKAQLNELDMSTVRRRLKSPLSLSGTSAHPTMVTLVNIMVMKGWVTSFSFPVNRLSHSWDKAISDSRVKVKVMGVVKGQGHTIGPVSYKLTSFSFHFNQTNNSWDRAIFKFDLETSKVKVMSEVKGQGHPTDALPSCFTSIRPTIPEIWPK